MKLFLFFSSPLSLPLSSSSSFLVCLLVPILWEREKMNHKCNSAYSYYIASKLIQPSLLIKILCKIYSALKLNDQR